MDWKSIVGTVAPTLATALGGPLAGLAVQTIGSLFGLGDKADEQAVMAAVKGATPDDLLKLKGADADFKLKMAQLGVDLERIAADDRNSARVNQAATKSRTPDILMFVLTVGFFGLLALMWWRPPPDQCKDMLMVMVGTLGTAWTAGVTFFYGSSAGSAKMKDIMGAK